MGELLYAATGTRPDIAAAVNAVCRYNNNPGIQHWTAVKRILRYLKGTSKLGITLGGPELELQLVGYADADWASDLDTRRSTTGYVFKLGSYPVTWKSKLQITPALSSMEAELMAISAANQEALWIRKFLENVGYQQTSATILHEDNQSCIKFVYGTKYSPSTKHIGVRYYFIRDSIKNNDIQVKYLPTDQMTADIFTKALPTVKFEKHRDDMGMRAPSSGSVESD